MPHPSIAPSTQSASTQIITRLYPSQGCSYILVPLLLLIAPKADDVRLDIGALQLELLYLAVNVLDAKVLEVPRVVIERRLLLHGRRRPVGDARHRSAGRNGRLVEEDDPAASLAARGRGARRDGSGARHADEGVAVEIVHSIHCLLGSRELAKGVQRQTQELAGNIYAIGCDRRTTPLRE